MSEVMDASRRRRGWLASLAAIVAIALTAPGAAAQGSGRASGDSPVSEDGADARASLEARYGEHVALGNRLYNEENYAGAREAYVDAIQLIPRRGEAYRNLARAMFWAKNYAMATEHYDHYLQVASQAKDGAQIRKERKLAATRSGGEGYTLPREQRLALEALEKQLEGGDAYTKGGGGAWGVWRALLRTGYAQPRLATLRGRLVRALLDEYAEATRPASGQPTPTLSLEEWKVQAERLAAASELAREEEDAETIAAREKIVVAARAMLSESENADELAAAAVAANPDVLFVRWFLVATLLQEDRAKEALSEIDELTDVLERHAPGQLGYARIVRAIALQRLDRREEAARQYLDVLDK